VVLVYRWEVQGRDMVLNTIEIWSPKYSTDEVLIDPKKVAAHNLIIFTKAKHLEGKQFYLSGLTIRQSHLVSNGKIMCHAVPMDKLELIATPENNKQRRLV